MVGNSVKNIFLFCDKRSALKDIISSLERKYKFFSFREDPFLERV